MAVNSLNPRGFKEAWSPEAPARRRVLIASANPYAFCIAVEQHLAGLLGEECQVDALNLYKLASRHSPYHSHWSQRLVTRLNRPFERFVLPRLSGCDITRSIKVDPAAIPPMPIAVQDLRDYELDGAKIGIGVMSSLISLTTISTADRVDEFGAAAAKAWRSAHMSFQVAQAVKDLAYDEIYIFSGRHCFARPFCDVLESHTNVIKYETGGSEDTTTYITSEHSVHDPASFAQIVNEHDIDPEAGARFYEERLRRAENNPATHFRSLQTDGLLPAGVSSGDYVAFFTSSADERLAALGIEDLGEFPGQNALALELARICDRAGKKLIVRLHPHLRFKHPSWRKAWDFQAIAEAGAILLEPTDPCDSYALARSSHCVVTGGSTLSFECSYLGVPSITVGDSLPVRMGATAPAVNAADLAAFIAAPKLVDGAREAALAFGSYTSIGGIPIPGYDLGDNVRQARLNGRILDPVRYLSHPVRRMLGK